MSWSLLERFLKSDLFDNDPSLAVAYLSRYASHVGIQYALVAKLRRFNYEDLEFFLPQLCHILVTVGASNESMALESFVLDLCQESVSGALLTFWLFQTHLHDLSSTPQSNSFKTCRRIFNKVQSIVFGSGSLRAEKIEENVLPTTVLASLVLSSVAVPFATRELGPLAVAQARRPRPPEETISEAPPVQRVTRSHTVASLNKPKIPQSGHGRSGSEAPTKSPESRPRPPKTSSKTSTTRHVSRSKPPTKQFPPSKPHSPFMNGTATLRLSTSSLPDIAKSTETSGPDAPPLSAGRLGRFPKDLERRPTGAIHVPQLATMSWQEKIHALRSNYFKNETQFLSALEGISNRLVIVPKPARLSALRAELALVARDLPAEVDFPALCPATLEDGSPAKSKHHRVVRINPAEATSLNSAERVPYLLMVEVLREDFDFNPDTEANQRLLAMLIQQKDSSRRRLFDITPAARASVEHESPVGPDSVFEPATGDLSSPSLLASFPEETSKPQNPNPHIDYTAAVLRGNLARSSSGTNTLSSLSMLSTPRTSDVPSSRASSPGPRRLTIGNGNKPPAPQEDRDFSALATHMRTAAQMLAQLEMSGSKRPKHEVEAIKSKIIASMQNLEEENFYSEESTPVTATSTATTFDSIMANVARAEVPVPATSESPVDIETDPERNSEGHLGVSAGAARMENDQKTGGVRRKGDRDDPSAATFGEEWRSKKDRIRRSSPYGWMKNWDLLSVIVKTGSDLRQEMFATQLIRLCAKIWEDGGVPVWVKQMKILVTGESSGLIETITNGVSLHSLKRSLTLSTIAAGTNPRKRFASLKDHFIRTFGEVDTPGYQAASDCFKRSLAAYSIISYILQLKDRHNGNILIDNVGHIIHIDFGFMLSNSPGSVGFEAAPFKLTQDYVDVLGGSASPEFEDFKALCKQAFQALRKSADTLVSIVEIMGRDSKMACFASGGTAYAVNALRHRFCLHMTREEAEGYVEELVGKSLGSYYTRLYDTFQYRTQGIY